MTWENVGKEYTTVFHEALNNYTPYPIIRNIVNFLPNKLFEVKADHLTLLTDNWGIIQHTDIDVPALNHGYNTNYGFRRLSNDPKKGDFNLK
jgi:hypothetical protein